MSRAEALSSFRALTGLSQPKFAAVLGTTKSIIANLESGRTPVSDDWLNGLCQVAELDQKSFDSKAFKSSSGGQPYTKENWLAAVERPLEDLEIGTVEQLIEHAIRGAFHLTRSNRYPAAQRRLWLWRIESLAADVIHGFGAERLSEAVRSVGQESSLPVELDRATLEAMFDGLDLNTGWSDQLQATLLQIPYMDPKPGVKHSLMLADMKHRRTATFDEVLVKNPGNVQDAFGIIVPQNGQ